MTINISDNVRDKFNKLLNLYSGNPDNLVTAMIDFKIKDLKSGIQNIEFDLTQFERKYGIDSSTFYEKFSNGLISDENDDFIQWSGEYEVLQDFRNELNLIL